MRYVYTVVLETDTDEHASMIMSERLNYDDLYYDEQGNSFDYEFVDYWRTPSAR